MPDPSDVKKPTIAELENMMEDGGAEILPDGTVKRPGTPIEKLSGGQCAHGVAGASGCHKCKVKVIPDLPSAKWPAPLPLKAVREFIKEHQPGSVSIPPAPGIPSSKGTLPPVGTPIVRELLDEKNRDRARGEDVNPSEGSTKGMDPDLLWCIRRIRELESQLRVQQALIVDLRLAVKGLQ